MYNPYRTKQHNKMSVTSNRRNIWNRHWNVSTSSYAPTTGPPGVWALDLETADEWLGFADLANGAWPSVMILVVKSAWLLAGVKCMELAASGKSLDESARCPRNQTPLHVLSASSTSWHVSPDAISFCWWGKPAGLRKQTIGIIGFVAANSTAQLALDLCTSTTNWQHFSDAWSSPLVPSDEVGRLKITLDVVLFGLFCSSVYITKNAVRPGSFSEASSLLWIVQYIKISSVLWARTSPWNKTCCGDRWETQLGFLDMTKYNKQSLAIMTPKRGVYCIIYYNQ